MGSTWQKGVNTAETNSVKMLHTSLRLHMCLRVLLGYKPKKQSQKSFLFTLKFCFSTSGPSTHRLKFLTEICNNGANVRRKTLPFHLHGGARPAAIKQIKGGVKCPISAIPHKFSLFLFRNQTLYFQDQNLLVTYCFEDTTQMHRELRLLTWCESSGDAHGRVERESRHCSFLAEWKRAMAFLWTEEVPRDVSVVS